MFNYVVCEKEHQDNTCSDLTMYGNYDEQNCTWNIL